MPFSSEHGVIYGDDARSPSQWARTTFCTWLASKLNAPEGPYATGLGITAGRQAIVSDNVGRLKRMYSLASSPPAVGVIQGPVDSGRSGKKINDIVYRGARHEMTLELDMGVKDRAPGVDDQSERSDDSLLAGFVADAVRRGFKELYALGINNSDMQADLEKQRAGEGRHPHIFTFFIVTLDDWAPG
jgi:hypothetical protein